MERTSESGLPIDPVDDSKLTDSSPDSRRGRPAKYPFTRGVCPRMFLDRPPAVRRYAGGRVIVGMNRFTADVDERHRPPRFDPAPEAEQAALLATLRKQRDDTTLGEVCDALRDVWGVRRPEGI